MLFGFLNNSEKIKPVMVYLLIYVYAFSMVKPSLPFIFNLLAHTFSYSEHIQTVHKDHGKYHVHYEYTEAAKKGTAEKNTTNLKNEPTVNEHFLNGNSYEAVNSQLVKNEMLFSSFLLPNAFLTLDEPPPK